MPTRSQETRALLSALLLLRAIFLSLGFSGSGHAAASVRVAPAPVYTQDAGATKAGGPADLFLRRVREKGTLPVLVGLRMPLHAEDTLSDAQLRAQADTLARMQDRLTARVLGKDQSSARRYTFIPFVALMIDEGGFRRLLNDPEVTSIEEDVSSQLQSDDLGEEAAAKRLSDSTRLIHDDVLLKQYGLSGKGQTVAILDTGVAKSHPMLKGKLVSEACYSTNDTATSTRSLCPRGVSSSTAAGSGVNCPTSLRGCDHGTLVASVAAGSQVGKLRGVASGASIIAIQVFSKITDANQCGSPAKTPCVSTRTSDQVSALQRVHGLRKKFKIAAVNMSFGGGSYATACDDLNPALTASFAQLRRDGIAPIVASGNEGSDTGVASPACISTAVTVGSSSKGDTGTQLEYVSSFSNMNSLVDLMAPGENIKAAVPGNAGCASAGSPYCRQNGTSIAAPHVAGAFAVLREAKPTATLDRIESALTCSGKIVEYSKNPPAAKRIAKPRIDLLGAYGVLKPLRKRSWSFDDPPQAFDWSPFTHKFLVSNGVYEAQQPPPAEEYVLTTTANCDLAVDVTADMTRKYPNGSGAANAGLMLKAHFDYEARAISGYLFVYSSWKGQGSASIFRVDNSYTTRLCDARSGVPVKRNKKNTIRAVSDDSAHKLYVNGKLVCSAPNDGIHGPGAVSIFGGLASTTPGLGGSFTVDSLTIKSKAIAKQKELVDRGGRGAGGRHR